MSKEAKPEEAKPNPNAMPEIPIADQMDVFRRQKEKVRNVRLAKVLRRNPILAQALVDESEPEAEEKPQAQQPKK